MSLFDRLFRTSNAGVSTTQLDIKFGRYTDSYKTPLNYQAWEQSLALFEEDKYLDAYRAFFQYLRDEREDNVRWWTEDGTLRFELYQGSKKITGYANDAKFLAESRIAYSEALNVGFMRRLIERNFILQFSRFALDILRGLERVHEPCGFDGFDKCGELRVRHSHSDNIGGVCRRSHEPRDCGDCGDNERFSHWFQTFLYVTAGNSTVI